MIRTQMPECFHPLRLSHLCFSTPYSSLIDQAGITTFPVCGTLGFTEVPGDNEIGVWPPPPVSRHVCVSSCHRNSTCKAVSYAKQYKLCSYYRKYMKDDHLIEDRSSNFEHYDEVCRKRGYWESEDVSVVSVGLGDWGVMLLKYNDRFRVLLLLLLLPPARGKLWTLYYMSLKSFAWIEYLSPVKLTNNFFERPGELYAE